MKPATPRLRHTPRDALEAASRGMLLRVSGGWVEMNHPNGKRYSSLDIEHLRSLGFLATMNDGVVMITYSGRRAADRLARRGANFRRLRALFHKAVTSGAQTP